ncbi:MAG: hypothetical protein ABW005_14265 [Burkholderiaceae bacterium]
MIAALGTAQPERDDPRREPGFARLDDRDEEALLQTLRALAPKLRFYADDPLTPSGDWSPFLPASVAALEAQAASGRVAPHHALLLAFLRQLARPQALLNRFTAEHLQFQMQRVLGFAPLPPRPDRVHLVLELKKGAAPLEITPAQRFSAGKDAAKVEQLFAPLRSTVIGQARLERAACVRRQGQRLLFAPLADSADGLGAPLDKDAPRWPPFGHARLPAAPVGFALAAPVLRLAEGRRRIGIRLRVAGWPTGVTASALAASFEAHLSGPGGWLGPLPLTGALSGDLLSLSLELGSALEAVVDHDPAIHLHAFPAAVPVIQLLLKDGAPLAYGDLAGLSLDRAQIGVEVQGMRGLQLENDEAQLNPKKAFLPFGARPVAGARVHVGCPEALAKRLTALKIHLGWQGAPADLYNWYENYSRRGQLSNGVTATATWQDADGTSHTSAPLTLLPRMAAATELQISAAGMASAASASSPAAQSRALQWSGSAQARRHGLQLGMARPVLKTAPAQALKLAGLLGSAPPAPAARAGFVTLSLVEDLLHGDFRRESLQAALPPANPAGFVPKILNEPYTPKVQEISLDYSAESDDSRIGDASEAAFAGTELQFFQLDALGLAREQAWLSAGRPWSPPGAIPLLPPHPAAAELMLGFSGLQAGDSLSLLAQLAEGSADPQATPQRLRWSVLADNSWRPLLPGELALDSSDGLRRSGLIGCVLPAETSTANTRAPAGLVWLRAEIAAQPEAVCEVIGLHANAIEIGFVDQGNDPQRLAAPLPAGSIARMKQPLAALKAISQPYASFDGALQEGESALARRASERLRHRNRAITGWDVERLVLQAFPGVFRAKCIPHASESSWLAGGHMMVVVVPDLKGLAAVDPLRPRVDLDTLARIQAYLAARCGPQTRIHVRNPRYRAVRLDFKLRLRPGYGFNFHGPQLDQALRRVLSPWAFDAGAGLGFGARVLRAELLRFVEAQPYVDFVTDFHLAIEGGPDDQAELLPGAPDEILVSAPAHAIEELRDA